MDVLAWWRSLNYGQRLGFGLLVLAVDLYLVPLAVPGHHPAAPVPEHVPWIPLWVFAAGLVSIVLGLLRGRRRREQ